MKYFQHFHNYMWLTASIICWGALSTTAFAKTKEESLVNCRYYSEHVYQVAMLRGSKELSETFEIIQSMESISEVAKNFLMEDALSVYAHPEISANDFKQGAFAFCAKQVLDKASKRDKI